MSSFYTSSSDTSTWTWVTYSSTGTVTTPYIFVGKTPEQIKRDQEKKEWEEMFI